MPEQPTLTRIVKVLVLLYLARLIVYHLWNWGVDPDNAAIPCLTGCGDFLGTGFLTLAYALLYYMGDESAVRRRRAALLRARDHSSHCAYVVFYAKLRQFYLVLVMPRTLLQLSGPGAVSVLIAHCAL
ncbi:hypothetical protein HPB51_027625 [Rhipicephalus microplus]|uniref:SLC41A/MgtE integral membrane domain-containing protein n=1 Tax=Rhipicephalus microplus TaxID=6941 RepID=A0A9J6CZW5_RHIMP|nr:hypothetical protein HPB51_027625 [Rhipicephalus microplus]